MCKLLPFARYVNYLTLFELNGWIFIEIFGQKRFKYKFHELTVFVEMKKSLFNSTEWAKDEVK